MRIAAGIAVSVSMVAGMATACDLRVESAWIRAAPPQAPALAGYATLVNSGTRPHRIVAAESNAAGVIMFHESLLQGGVAMMRELQEIAVPAGGRSELAPGGRHLMLMALRSALQPGDHVTITLTDETGCRVAGDFVVRAP
ncbi:MAG: copper chaperone PCu(A)C [Gammaproteobacteria bacterium]|nr:copper chaperone PCu(A)C [Gammaproteobacteria bacterium]